MHHNAKRVICSFNILLIVIIELSFISSKFTIAWSIQSSRQCSVLKRCNKGITTSTIRERTHTHRFLSNPALLLIGCPLVRSGRKENQRTHQNWPLNVVRDDIIVREDCRSVVQLVKNARLPIWPVWNGVFLFLLSKLPFISPESIAELEASIGGRVCPNFFPQTDDMHAWTFNTSPFIMLVHHVHNFHPLDPLRYIQRSFFPEGFPAHPHRGFCTITYCLHGGMIHRDSMGVHQAYGASRDHSTQLLIAGKGILHEEMWDNARESKQELFQLWLNLPAKYKMIQPKIQLLAEREGSMPTVFQYDTQGDGNIKISSTLIIAGSYEEQQSAMTLFSDITILHVSLFKVPALYMAEEKIPCWRFRLPDDYRTAILYTRSGSIQVAGAHVPPHHTVYLSQTGKELVVSLDHSTSNMWLQDHEQQIGADFIILAGKPLDEPVVAEGSMVMNSHEEIRQAYQDYQMGTFGLPWKETLSDDEWQAHVKTYR